MTVPSGAGRQGVLLCGLYGTGKTSVAEEIAVHLEHDGSPFAALDLDWLSWFGTNDLDPHANPTVFLANLSAIVGNYLEVGVRRFVLAGSVADRSEAEAIRSVPPFPVTIVELRAPWEVIERRLRSSPTAGRLEDLDAARAHRDAGHGPTPDAVVDADRPLSDIAVEVLRLLGWLDA
jgi:hypothetical protein